LKAGDGRVLSALRSHGDSDDRRLAYHAAGAGDRDAVLHHAPRAAARASRLGAHREAAEQYRLALRFPDSSQENRARLFAALSYECYLTDQLDEALSTRREAMELAELAGDGLAVGTAQRWLSRLSWFLSRNEDGERYAHLAIATLEPLGDGPELAMAYSDLAQLGMPRFYRSTQRLPRRRLVDVSATGFCCWRAVLDCGEGRAGYQTVRPRRGYRQADRVPLAA